MARGCVVPGCPGKHKAHGLCNPHYQNARNAKTYAIVARGDREMYQAVVAYANRHGMTIAETLRTFIEWGLENGLDR